MGILLYDATMTMIQATYRETQTQLKRKILETREASRRLVRELDVIKEKVGFTGITYTQGHILLYLETHGLLMTNELADIMRLDKSTTSRAVATMINRGYVKFRENSGDKRIKPIALTSKGKNLVERVHQVANTEVEGALAILTDEERETVLSGMRLYARALSRSRKARQYRIRKIRKGDNEYMARIIGKVTSEFELSGPGISLYDQDVKAMYQAYGDERATYYVVVDGDRVVGGAGVAQLAGAGETVCELKKMYLLPEARGVGLGERLLRLCLDAAKEAGYKTCYLETIREMSTARSLYEKYGFKRLDGPMGNTGHFRADFWFARQL